MRPWTWRKSWATPAELAVFLGALRDRMGLDPAPADRDAARRMREWYDASTSRFASR